MCALSTAAKAGSSPELVAAGKTVVKLLLTKGECLISQSQLILLDKAQETLYNQLKYDFVPSVPVEVATVPVSNSIRSVIYNLVVENAHEKLGKILEVRHGYNWAVLVNWTSKTSAVEKWGRTPETEGLDSPLLVACKQSSFECLRLLLRPRSFEQYPALKKRLDVNIRSKNGSFPLLELCRHATSANALGAESKARMDAQKRCLEILLEEDGIQLFARDYATQDSPLKAVCSIRRADLLSLLLAHRICEIGLKRGALLDLEKTGKLRDCDPAFYNPVAEEILRTRSSKSSRKTYFCSTENCPNLATLTCSTCKEKYKIPDEDCDHFCTKVNFSECCHSPGREKGLLRI